MQEDFWLRRKISITRGTQFLWILTTYTVVVVCGKAADTKFHVYQQNIRFLSLLF